MTSARRFARVPLERRDVLDGGYFVLTFDASDAPIEAAAGQFAMLRGEGWGSAPLLPRPMSLLSHGAAPTILIKVVGEGTRRLATAPIGERFELFAPLGVPWRMPQADEAPILVAGGVGVAPLVYLARALGGGALSLYGGRTSQDLPLAGELERHGRLEVATEDGSRGTHGRVTVLLERALDAQASKPARVYACGPHGMMAAVAAICATRNLSCEVSLEAPMGCGYGVCLGCPVARRAGGYLYACVDGPCVDAALIDWSREVFA